MVNAGHLKLLRQGAKPLEQWINQNPGNILDFSGADLCGIDLSGANLLESNLNFENADLREAKFNGIYFGDVNFSGSDLREADFDYAYVVGANLKGADLREAKLLETDFTEADLSKANLSGTWLRGTHFQYADLIEADLSRAQLEWADLGEAVLLRANLRNANFYRVQASSADFSDACLTGACIDDWKINCETKLQGVLCDYIYSKVNNQERRPRSGNFGPGEFAALFQQAIDTVDLIFVDGLDWQSFFASFQEIRQQYDGAEINIQAIEKKSGGAFIVRLEASESLDKADLQKRLTTAYKENQQLQAQLLKTEGKLEGYKEQLDDFQQKVLQGMNSPKYDLRGAQIAGGVADTVQGEQVGGTINSQAAGAIETPSLVGAVAEIQDLLKQLEASNANATKAEQIAFLSAMIPPTKRERFIGALKSAGSAAIEEVPYGAVLKALVEGWQKPGG